MGSPTEVVVQRTDEKKQSRGGILVVDPDFPIELESIRFAKPMPNGGASGVSVGGGYISGGGRVSGTVTRLQMNATGLVKATVSKSMVGEDGRKVDHVYLSGWAYAEPRL